MPRRALRPCANAGCRVLVSSGRCQKHQADMDAVRAEWNARTEASRRERSVPTWDKRWRALRATQLTARPLCSCGARATHVDHVVPEAIAPERVLDPTNVQSMCARCHTRKTNAQDGGYGNPRR